MTVLNMFMPNGVPFINSGQEVFETQPITDPSFFFLSESTPLCFQQNTEQKQQNENI